MKRVSTEKKSMSKEKCLRLQLEHQMVGSKRDPGGWEAVLGVGNVTPMPIPALRWGDRGHIQPPVLAGPARAGLSRMGF